MNDSRTAHHPNNHRHAANDSGRHYPYAHQPQPCPAEALRQKKADAYNNRMSSQYQGWPLAYFINNKIEVTHASVITTDVIMVEGMSNIA